MGEFLLGQLLGVVLCHNFRPCWEMFAKVTAPIHVYQPWIPEVHLMIPSWSLNFCLIYLEFMLSTTCLKLLSCFVIWTIYYGLILSILI